MAEADRQATGRLRLGLALSGGGLRATLFHLGVIRSLCEQGLLSQVGRITAVSGGSIVAAHLHRHWHRYVSPESFDEAAAGLVDLMARDLRGRIVRRLPLLGLAWPIRRLRRTRTDLLKRYLGDFLLGSSTFSTGGEEGRPELEILSTNIRDGALCSFSSDGLIPDCKNDEQRIKKDLDLALSVTASAAFPAFFPPVEVRARDLHVGNKELPQALWLTDGGVYDNLGVRRFRSRLKRRPREFDRIIVSDASGAFDWIVDKRFLPFLGTAIRATDILMKRLRDVEHEISLGSRRQRKFVVVAIQEAIDDTENPALPHGVQSQLEHVRTDLDRFSPLEIAALTRHGAELATRTIEREPRLAGASARSEMPPAPYWQDFPKAGSSSATKMEKRLWRSRKRRLGLVAFGDWPTYLYLSVLITLLLGGFLLADLYTQRRVAKELRRASLPQIVNDGVRVMADERRINLEDWQVVPAERRNERLSPVYWQRVTEVIKSEDAQAMRFRFSSSGLGASVKCTTHAFHIESSRSPSARRDTVNYVSDSVVDVSNVAIGDRFTIAHEATYWNSFQNPSREFVALIGEAAEEEISVLVTFPATKLWKEFEIFRYRRLGLGRYGEFEPLPPQAVIGDREKRTLYWRIPQPEAGYNYRLSWSW